MNNRVEILAVIPARGGSKSIPRKNIKPFAGYPLIAYSIAAGLQSEAVTRTIVSTDSEEIGKVAQEYGAEVPFLRPAEYSQDDTSDLPVFEHALNWLACEEDYHPQVVVQLRPTSPVRPKKCVDDAVNLLLSSPEADSVRGVVMAGQNPYKMWQIDNKGKLIPLIKVEGIDEPYNVPRQELSPVYWQTGHIDAIRPRCILEKKSMSGKTILPLIIDPIYTVDIDTEFDWQLGEQLVKSADLDMVMPGVLKRKWPEKVELLVLDFDGVLTDDRVWVDEDGHEMVAAIRSDGLGLDLLRDKTKIKLLVISRETNPVVIARCKKLNMLYIQGVTNKAEVLKNKLEEKGIHPSHTIYIGNDLNDLPCFPIVGFAVAPANAYPAVLQRADLILERSGGQGAVRELCELLVSRYA